MKTTENTQHHSNAPANTHQAQSFFKKAGDGIFSNSKPVFFPGIKTKVEVSNPGDPEELEADAIAGKIMRMDDHQLHHV